MASIYSVDRGSDCARRGSPSLLGRVAAIVVIAAASVGMETTLANAQASAPPSNAVPPTALTVVTPHAPPARQIEPMVAPVRRWTPNAAPATVAKATVPTPKSAPATPPAASLAAVPASPLPATALPAAAPARMPSAVAAKPATKNKQQKFVAYTCKQGQDYSLERKACVTQGTKVSSAPARRAPKVASKVTLDASSRSALGAKPRR